MVWVVQIENISKSHRLISWQRGFYISFVVLTSVIKGLDLIGIAHQICTCLGYKSLLKGYIYIGFNLQFTFSVIAHWPAGLYYTALFHMQGLK